MARPIASREKSLSSDHAVTFPELAAYAAKRPVLDVPTMAAETGTALASLRVAINRWAAAGKIERLCQGRYRLAPPHAKSLTPAAAAGLAHQLVDESYLSLTWALRYHGLLPTDAADADEFTSVTGGPRRSFANSGGRYTYQRLPQDLWWGFELVRHQGQRFPLATASKALLDLWQLHPGEWTPSRQRQMGWRVGKGREQLAELATTVERAARPRLDRALESFRQIIR